MKFHRIADEGNTVLTERTDAIIIGPFRLQFWVCGAFEVHGGRITLWRDYFDLDFFVNGPLRGLVGAVVFRRCARRCDLRPPELAEFVERLRPTGRAGRWR